MNIQGKSKIRLPIRNKMILGFFCIFVVIVISIFSTLVELGKIRNFTISLSQRELPTFERVQRLKNNMLNSMAVFHGYLFTRDTALENEREQYWATVSRAVDGLNQYLENLGNSGILREWIDVKSLLTRLKDSQEKVISHLNGANKNGSYSFDENKQLLKEATQLSKEIQEKVGQLGDGQQPGFGLVYSLNKELRKGIENVVKDLRFLTILEWVLLVVAAILVIAIAWVTAHSIVPPILEAILIARRIEKGDRNLEIKIQGRDETRDLLVALDGMYKNILSTEQQLRESENKVQDLLLNLQERIKVYREHVMLVSKGDLRKTLDVLNDDELSQLGLYLNEMTQSLKQIAKKIIQASNDIASGTNELENTASAQAASATEQASSVTEISSVVEEIKSTSLQTLEKAIQVGESAEITQQEGEKGRQALENMKTSMESLQDKMKQIADTVLGLSDRTQQVGEITEAVSSLAKQSKMLALNASIEAAKAGEAGKGFAVVANEVKEFAEQSQQNTEKVQKILQDIQRTTERAVMNVEEGMKSVISSLERVKNTGEIISSLSEVLQQSAISSQQIAVAVRQESEAFEQVVTSISEIDKVTKQFTKATFDTKQASQNLSDVASMLSQSVSIYKVDE